MAAGDGATMRSPVPARSRGTSRCRGTAWDEGSVRSAGAGRGSGCGWFPLLLVVVSLSAACSGGGDAEVADDGGTSVVATVAPTEGEAAAAVEQFAGPVEAFYQVPDPLPPGEPGELIRTMAFDAPAGETGLRIMYHSTDAEGEDRAVTGVVTYPTGPAPDGGWPVVAWAHGTTGLAAVVRPEPQGVGTPRVRGGGGPGGHRLHRARARRRGAPVPERRRRGQRGHRQRRRGALAARRRRR